MYQNKIQRTNSPVVVGELLFCGNGSLGVQHHVLQGLAGGLIPNAGQAAVAVGVAAVVQQVRHVACLRARDTSVDVGGMAGSKACVAQPGTSESRPGKYKDWALIDCQDSSSHCRHIPGAHQAAQGQKKAGDFLETQMQWY